MLMKCPSWPILLMLISFISSFGTALNSVDQSACGGCPLGFLYEKPSLQSTRLGPLGPCERSSMEGFPKAFYYDQKKANASGMGTVLVLQDTKIDSYRLKKEETFSTNVVANIS